VCNHLGSEVSVVLYYGRERNPGTTLKGLVKLAGPDAVLHKQGIVQCPVLHPRKTDLEIKVLVAYPKPKPFSK